MQGKVVVITGGTSGIGREAARQLAAQGASLVLVGRTAARCAASVAWLKERVPAAEVSTRVADLLRLAEMRRLAADLAASLPRIDVLVNNAGAIFDRHEQTGDGLERTFALNHMAYFVLTHALREPLIASAPARIVNTASNAHRGNALDFDDLQFQRGFRGLTAYARSKLANILFTRELARRLAGTGVTANCLHPGFVSTGIGQRDGGLFAIMVRMSMLFARTPEQGASTIVYLATSPDVAGASGGYYVDCRQAEPTRTAQDDATARRLWEESLRLAGLQD